MSSNERLYSFLQQLHSSFHLKKKTDKMTKSTSKEAKSTTKQSPTKKKRSVKPLPLAKPLVYFKPCQKFQQFKWENVKDKPKKKQEILYKVNMHWKMYYGKPLKALSIEDAKNMKVVFRKHATMQFYQEEDSIKEFANQLTKLEEKKSAKKSNRMKARERKNIKNILDGKKGPIKSLWFLNSLSKGWYRYWLEKQILNDEEAAAFIEAQTGSHADWRALASLVFQRLGVTSQVDEVPKGDDASTSNTSTSSSSFDDDDSNNSDKPSE